MLSNGTVLHLYMNQMAQSFFKKKRISEITCVTHTQGLSLRVRCPALRTPLCARLVPTSMNVHLGTISNIQRVLQKVTDCLGLSLYKTTLLDISKSSLFCRYPPLRMLNRIPSALPQESPRQSLGHFRKISKTTRRLQLSHSQSTTTTL